MEEAGGCVAARERASCESLSFAVLVLGCVLCVVMARWAYWVSYNALVE